MANPSRSGVKRKALSVTEKREILCQYDAECTLRNQKKIAQLLDLKSSTLRTILQNRSNIEEQAAAGRCKRRKIKTAKFEELETVLLAWVQQARGANIVLNGPSGCEGKD